MKAGIARFVLAVVMGFACGSLRAQSALVAHWKMDEAAEAASLDPTVGASTITKKNGMVSGVAAVDATGVSMPGGAGHIVNSTLLIPATDDFGVFMWIAFTNNPVQTGQMHLFSCNAGQVNRCNFMVVTGGSNLGFFHAGGAGCTGEAVVNDGAWHHVGFTRTGGVIQLWVDGVPDGAASAASATPISQAQDWRIGSFVSETAGLYYGQMDDLRVYHGAVTTQEVAALTASYVPAQAVHRWRFNEAAGATVFAPDQGWMSAMAKKAPAAGVRAPEGTGIALDGQNLLRIPSSKMLIPATNDFSVFMWMRDDAAVTTNVQLFSCNAAGGAQPNRCSLGLSYNATTEANKLYFYHPDGRVAGKAVVRDGGWHHVGLVRRGTCMELWADGDLDSTNAYAAGFAISQAYDWRVGAGASETVNFLTGRLDDLRIYTNALSAAEIAALYDSYTPANSLIAHWKFEDAANVRIIEPAVGWREIKAKSSLQVGAAGVDGTGVWASTNSRGHILGSKKLIPATNDFTVLLWMRTTPSSTGNEKMLFTNNNGQKGRCNLSYDASGANKLTFWADTTYGLKSVAAGTGSAIDDGVWHQVGFSRNNKTLYLWLDGVNVSSVALTAATPMMDQTNDWFIASNAKPNAPAAWYGDLGGAAGYALMDDVRVYNYALSAGDVLGLYSAFAPLPSGVPAAPLTDHSVIEAAIQGKVVGHLAQVSEERNFHLPSLAVLSGGTYAVSATVLSSPLGVHTKVFRSSDSGASWARASEVAALYGGAVFASGGSLYLIGNNGDGGTVVIRRSSDNGTTWTAPVSDTTGILTTNTGWNFRAGAPTVHNGRVWFYVERRGNTARGTYSANVEAGALSAPAGADLLSAANWTTTLPLTPIPASWDTAVNFRGWTDGRTVADKAGTLRMLMRVDRFSDHAEYMALLAAGAPDAALTHTPIADMALFPGGAGGFGVRYDPVSTRFWALTNPDASTRAGLFSSFTLRDWMFHTMVLEAQPGKNQAFGWPEFQIDGNDLVSVYRTTYADQDGEPASGGDQNFIVFKRIANFRQLAGDKEEARLLAADGGNGCVRRYSFGSQYGWLFDDGANTIFAQGVYAGQALTLPFGLASDGGSVFVGERVAGGRILTFSKRGVFLGVLTQFDSGTTPGSLAVGADGRVYVTDEQGERIVRITVASGAAEEFLPTSGSGYTLNEPRGLTFDDAGNLYVANGVAGQILKFASDGTLLAQVALAEPQGLAWDAESGRVLAAVYATPDIVSVNPADMSSTAVLNNTVAGQQFVGLAKVNGTLYFTSDTKNRVNRQAGATSYTAADIRLSSPGQLLLLPQGAAVFPEARLGTKMRLR